MRMTDYDWIDEVVERQMSARSHGSVYIRPMFSLIQDRPDGKAAARWPVPFSKHALDEDTYDCV